MNCAKIEEMLKVAEKEYSSVMFLSDSKSFMKMKIAQAKIQLLTSILAEDGGEVKECNHTIGLEDFPYQGYGIVEKDETRFCDVEFNFCPKCGTNLSNTEASQHTKGEAV